MNSDVPLGCGTAGGEGRKMKPYCSGLYAAKGAIEVQGGKIWFESEEGKGTQFFIELPLVEPGKAS